MDLKKVITGVVVKEATNKILPMDAAPPKLSRKAKLAALLATIASLATAASHFLGG